MQLGDQTPGSPRSPAFLIPGSDIAVGEHHAGARHSCQLVPAECLFLERDVLDEFFRDPFHRIQGNRAEQHPARQFVQRRQATQRIEPLKIRIRIGHSPVRRDLLRRRYSQGLVDQGSRRGPGTRLKELHPMDNQTCPGLPDTDAFHVVIRPSEKYSPIHSRSAGKHRFHAGDRNQARRREREPPIPNDPNRRIPMLCRKLEVLGEPSFGHPDRFWRRKCAASYPPLLPDRFSCMARQ